MKKLSVIVLVLIFATTISGCGIVDKAKEKAETAVEDGIKSVESEIENVVDDVKDQVDEAINDAEDNKTDDNVTVTSGDDIILYDDQLTGQALLDSLEYNIDPSFVYNVAFKTRSSYGDGITSESEMIMFKEDFKVVSQQDGITSTMLYLVDDGATYSWVNGESTGTVFFDDPDDTNDEVLDYNISDLLAEDAEVIDAHIEEYNGYPCVYIEYIEPYGDEYTGKMWISVEFGVELKIETYENQVLTMSYENYDMRWLKSVAADTFNLPQEVVFEEFDWNFDFDTTGPDGEGMDFNGIDLEGLDLDSLNLDGLDLEGLDLDSLNLDGLDLEGLNIDPEELQGLLDSLNNMQ